MSTKISWTVSREVLNELHAASGAEVTVYDLDQAIASKIRGELASMKFAEKDGIAKLSIDKSFNLAYGAKFGAKSSEEFRPFAALLRLSKQFDTFKAEFGGIDGFRGFPVSKEFETLKLWARTLRPRKLAKENETEAETEATTV